VSNELIGKIYQQMSFSIIRRYPQRTGVCVRAVSYSHAPPPPPFFFSLAPPNPKEKKWRRRRQRIPRMQRCGAWIHRVMTTMIGRAL